MADKWKNKNYHKTQKFQYDCDENDEFYMVSKEMGIQRRRRRSIHGKELYGKMSYASLKPIPSGSIYASCLDMNDENLISALMNDCTDVEDIIKKLREQTISLTKKRCVKAKLKPVEQSKILKLGFAKKIKYKMEISFQKLKINMRNFLYSFELWYSGLKLIEGKFGSSVATYFKFLRKLFILNCIVFLLNFFFIILPQVLSSDFQKQSISNGVEENLIYPGDNKSTENDIRQKHHFLNTPNNEDNLFFSNNFIEIDQSHFRLGNLFTGLGYLNDTILFYGHYVNSSISINNYTYDIPSAYFFSTALCYFLILCVLFISVAESYKKCYIETSNGIKNVFAEKIFCIWDFKISKSDAEELKYCSIHMELKELLNEFNNKKKRKTVFRIICTAFVRISLNLFILLLLIALGWYTSTYLDLHMDNADVPTIMMLMLSLTLLATITPIGFIWLAKIEFYDCPRTALYATLIRTFILHVLIIIMVIAHRLNSSSEIACWETVVGQDIYRLVILDFIIGVGDNMIEFIRSCLHKKWNKIELPEFNIALNTMNLIYNQALLYVGLYFSPGLSLIVSFKMLVTYYIKKWGAMNNCQPSKKPWRAAQMQTVFLSFAFLVFFGVIIGYGYVFTYMMTSNCGPFRGGKFIFPSLFYGILNDELTSISLSYISHFFHSGVVVVLLLLMMLAIYYLRTVNSVRRHIVKNLHLMIKDQVENKKKLLMKIHKAQEDRKIALKNNMKIGKCSS